MTSQYKNQSVKDTDVTDIDLNETAAVSADSLPKDPPAVVEAVSSETPEAPQTFTGRACFSVNVVELGVSVETAFLTESGEVMRLPAVFPNRAYAHEQIQALMRLVDTNFDEFERRSSSWFTSAS